MYRVNDQLSDLLTLKAKKWVQLSIDRLGMDPSDCVLYVRCFSLIWFLS